MVKAKAREYALTKLMEKMNTHSKMKKLRYKELKMQEYFKNPHIKISEMKTVFKFRTKMEKFGENYRGGEINIPCRLCGLHLDNQEMAFQCPVIRENLNVTGDIENVYSENIKMDIISAVSEISKFREEMIE